jgi:negative regulator of replication initiation
MNMTLRKVFGESASDLIYQLMERQVSLTREEAGEKIDAFHAYLKRLVGSEVSQIILASSLKALCRELQREYEEVEKYFSLLDELYEVKFQLLAPSLKEERSVCN